MTNNETPIKNYNCDLLPTIIVLINHNPTVNDNNIKGWQVNIFKRLINLEKYFTF